MRPEGIRALTFDVFGTVVDWHGGIASEAAQFLKRHSARPIDPAEFASAWRAQYQPAMERVRSGERAFVTLDVLHRENLEVILSQFGLDRAAIPESELLQLNLAWHRLPPWPDAVAGIARLRTRYITAALSNGNLSLLIDLARGAGIGWDAILGSDVVRAYKPAHDAYFRGVQLLGLAPEQVLMVATHPWDLAGARASGLRTAFVARPMENGVKRRVDPGGSWDVVAQDFHQLADLLEA